MNRYQYVMLLFLCIISTNQSMQCFYNATSHSSSKTNSFFSKKTNFCKSFCPGVIASYVTYKQFEQKKKKTDTITIKNRPYFYKDFNPLNPLEFMQVLSLCKKNEHYLFDPDQTASGILLPYIKVALFKKLGFITKQQEDNQRHFKVLKPYNNPITIAAALSYITFPNDMYIEMITTNEHFQRKGIATALFKDIEKKAILEDSKVSCRVFSTNTPQIDLLKKLNFKQEYEIDDTIILKNGEEAKLISFCKYQNNNPWHFWKKLL